jgi:multidrug efflux pump subunit AcrA (membrane-fusion protein)
VHLVPAQAVGPRVPDRTDATSAAEHSSDGPVPGAESSPKPRSTPGERRLTWTSWLIIVIVVVAIGGTVWVTTGSSGPAYRFATVTTGSPVQTLDSVGTLTPLNQANLNFGTSGTVASVSVTVGQVVSAGQTLAALDTTSLQSAVLSAQASAASAQAQLTADQNSQSSSSSSTPSATTATTASTAVTASTAALQSLSVSNPVSGNGTAITQAQSTLVADQKQADADQGQATADLQQAEGTCGGSTVTPPTTTSTTSTTTSTTTTTTSTTTPTTSTTTPAQAPSTACMSALQLVAADQNTVSQDQAIVATDEATLATTLASTAPGATKPTGSASGSGATGSVGSGASASGGTGSTQHGGSSGASSVATPQQLASDQAALDVANAEVASAQQDLSDANLLSPIAGTVASVAITPGAAVSAGSNVGPSADASIVILGPGSFVVTANIAVANIANVLVGQKATISPDATTKTVTGTVTSIGLIASTSSSTSYPVTLAMADANGLQLSSGADADVNIITKAATDVATIPSSAVQTVGANHFVTEYRNGTTSRVRITLGTVGDILTQVTSGVKPGATVVLADLNQAIPASSATTTGRRTFGAGGGLPGGAGGGLPGGARGGLPGGAGGGLPGGAGGGLPGGARGGLPGGAGGGLPGGARGG